MNWEMKPPHGPADEDSPLYAMSDPSMRKWRDPEPNGRMYEHTRSITRPFGVPGPYGYPFRTCWYDGSMHPEDLYNFLVDPALTVTLGGSDWKYGWPHKFYVEGIPNPLAGKKVCDGGTYGPGDERVMHYTAGPATTHAKFYTEHIADIIDQETLRIFTELLAAKSGVTFSMKDGQLNYRAPYHGYQA